MIDSEGYRPNVGIIITNRQGQVCWCRRFGQDSWQFPQGGVDEGESPEEAMYRELYEEVGLERDDVHLIGSTQNWLKYRLPKQLIRQHSKPLCIGQKQRWFLLRMKCDESKLNFTTHEKPEFDGWQWVSYWYPARRVVTFKRDVYRKAMKELLPMLSAYQRQLAGGKPHRTRKSGKNRRRKKSRNTTHRK